MARGTVARWVGCRYVSVNERFMHPVQAILNGGLPPDADPRRLQQVRTTTITVLAIIIMGVPFAIRYATLDLWGMTAAVSGAVVMGAAALVLIRTERWGRLSSHLAAAALFGLLTASNIVSGGFYDPNMGWLYVLPVAAGLLLGRAAGLAYTVLICGVILAFYAAPYVGIEIESAQVAFDSLCFS